MLKRYLAPDGSGWLFEEGKQPDGYVEAKAEAKKPEAKSRAPRNKSRTTKAK
jgi:hypothetical protein